MGKEGLFGWKARMFTWSPMDNKRNYQKLNGYQDDGENLIYGLIKDGDDRLIKIDENKARIINLAKLCHLTL